ncbi:MAG TPA: nuclear transport factor 2 family protein [Acidimicrobiales bacterium]|nr:nuclear transport factor 2 family protein [Acidimicrobiales bacterium]
MGFKRSNDGAADPMQVVSRFLDAANHHDADALRACVHHDFESIQPIHPGRNFRGSGQLISNWKAIFEAEPGFRLTVLRSAVADNTVWVEVHGAGDSAEAAGIFIVGVEDGRIRWIRVYSDLVESASVMAPARQVAPAPELAAASSEGPAPDVGEEGAGGSAAERSAGADDKVAAAAAIAVGDDSEGFEARPLRLVEGASAVAPADGELEGDETAEPPATALRLVADEEPGQPEGGDAEPTDPDVAETGELVDVPADEAEDETRPDEPADAAASAEVGPGVEEDGDTTAEAASGADATDAVEARDAEPDAGPDETAEITADEETAGAEGDDSSAVDNADLAADEETEEAEDVDSSAVDNADLAADEETEEAEDVDSSAVDNADLAADEEAADEEAPGDRSLAVDSAHLAADEEAPEAEGEGVSAEAAEADPEPASGGGGLSGRELVEPTSPPLPRSGEPPRPVREEDKPPWRRKWRWMRGGS